MGNHPGLPGPRTPPPEGRRGGREPGPSRAGAGRSGRSDREGCHRPRSGARPGGPCRDRPSPAIALQARRWVRAGSRSAKGPPRGCAGCWRLATACSRSESRRPTVLGLIPSSCSNDCQTPICRKADRILQGAIANQLHELQSHQPFRSSKADGFRSAEVDRLGPLNSDYLAFAPKVPTGVHQPELDGVLTH